VDRRGAVGVIVMDRPERFNALDVRMARDLRRAALALARDREVRCAVLAGTDRVFSSGADLKYVRQAGDPEDLSYLKPDAREVERGYGASFKEILEYLHSTISEIKRAPKPFVAAVKGIAAAGGFGLAMSCDLVYASEDAAFEWAYHKTGLTGAESSTFFLPRLVGLRRAMELMLLNPRLSAREALEAGLITGVFPRETFDAEVMAVAERLARGPTEAFGVAKALINQAAGVDRLDVHLDRELEALRRIAETPSFAEGLESFLAKREPRFPG
jgi:2-(1,2-epoxy-1,2-dihydrophenyl)acetyl-CoA isomerase